MKLIVTFKSPDAIDYAITEDTPMKEAYKFRQICQKYFEYGEYCKIEIDTETGKARVVPVRD